MDKPKEADEYWEKYAKEIEAEAKIEIETGEVIECYGFSESDVRQIVEFVKERKEDLKEEWNEYQK